MYRPRLRLPYRYNHPYIHSYAYIDTHTNQSEERERMIYGYDMTITAQTLVFDPNFIFLRLFQSALRNRITKYTYFRKISIFLA